MIKRNEKEHCNYCGYVKYWMEERTIANGQKRLYAKCQECQRYIRALPEEVTGSQEDYVMPFGKHKGKTLLLISQTDPDYLVWCSENLDSKNITRRINAFLDYVKPEHIGAIIPRALGDLFESGKDQA